MKWFSERLIFFQWKVIFYLINCTYSHWIKKQKRDRKCEDRFFFHVCSGDHLFASGESHSRWWIRSDEDLHPVHHLSDAEAPGICRPWARRAAREPGTEKLVQRISTNVPLTCSWTLVFLLQGVPAGGVSSHWESRVLRGSIMAAALGDSATTRIDAVTLAALQDTGWYSVNLSQAQSLVWGDGTGPRY